MRYPSLPLVGEGAEGRKGIAQKSKPLIRRLRATLSRTRGEGGKENMTTFPQFPNSKPARLSRGRRWKNCVIAPGWAVFSRL